MTQNEYVFSYPANGQAYTFRIACKAIVTPHPIFCDNKMHENFHFGVSALKVYLFRMAYGYVSPSYQKEKPCKAVLIKR